MFSTASAPPVRDLFEQRRKRPRIIFNEEIDAVGST
jgi:ATP-dependent Zn protease